MNIVLKIPDKVASRLSAKPDLERQALEALIVENYRQGRLTIDELGEALGFQTLDEIDGFLKIRGVHQGYSLDDLAQERLALDELGV